MEARSKIKPIYLELINYEFYHSPSAKDGRGKLHVKEDKRFIDRKNVQGKLRNLLYESETYSGTYLVTGFRGMGKTSHVRRVINSLPKNKPTEGNRKKINKEKVVHKFISIETSLAHDEINEVDIYKSLTRNILKEFENEYKQSSEYKRCFWLGQILGNGTYLILIFLVTILFSFLLNIFLIKSSVIDFNAFLGVLFFLLESIFLGFFFILLYVFFLPVLGNIINYWNVSSYFNRNFKGNELVNKLKQIKLNIEAQITTESSEGLGSSRSFFNVLTKKQEKREPIGPRDIESELISVLDEITEKFYYQFIIIFDELDKVDPNFNINIYDKESETPSMHQNRLGIEEKIRQRRESVVKLFSNMKHFLTVAKAKFIFIAGREMFDAALADISDRESYIGSIFHDVIYIGSFMRESYLNGSNDVTRLTEEYVCQFLVDDIKNEKEKDNVPSLQRVYSKLTSEGVGDNDALKVCVILQSFIIFLTYRSNGAPKKITQLFENQIKTSSQISHIVGDMRDEIHENFFKKTINEKFFFPSPKEGEVKDNQYYLYFNAEDQYRFNYNAKLFTPFLVTKSRYMRMYSDKLLVAATYILDHLYKFHKTAFAWSNLELTPEIIAINKAPELRSFIRDIMLDLENSHIRRIGSGLFDFRFNKLIFLEIDYLSKSFPEESAAFNFTLDESLETKRHYTKKLWQIKNEYNKKFNGKDAKYSYSIGFMHSIMGDLHFYDQEYDEAIIHYNESLETLVGENENNVIELKDYFVIYLKTALKLGLAYEKMNHFNNAFATYRMISDRVLKFSNKSPNQLRLGLNSVGNDIKETMGYLRLLYQSNLSKLVLYEKTGLNSIVYSDVGKAIKEFKGVYQSHDGVLENNPLIEIEYYSKLGDVLFFKNALFVGENENYRSLFEKTFGADLIRETNYFRIPKEALDNYYKALEIFCGRVYHNRVGQIPYYGFNKSGLIIMLEWVRKYLKNKGTNLNNPIRKEGVISAIALLLSKIGDALLSCVQKPDTLELGRLEKCLSHNGLEHSICSDNLNLLEMTFVCYRLSAGFFEKCNDMNMRSYQFRKILYLIKEFLACNSHLIEGKNREQFMKFLRGEFSQKLLKANHKMYQNANRVELVKYEAMMKKDFYDANDNDSFKSVLGKITSSTENDEVRFLLLEIELKLLGKKQFDRIIFPYSNINNQFNRLMALHHQIHLNWLEIQENKNCINILKSLSIKFCKKYVQSELDVERIMFFEQLFSTNKYNLGEDSIIASDYYCYQKLLEGLFNSGKSAPEEMCCEVIIDSLYCLTETLKILKIWGVSFAIGNSFQAFAHEKMGDWCIALFAVKQACKQGENTKEKDDFFDSIEDKLNDLIGKSSRQFLDFNYHYECAQRYYYDMLNAHNEGDAYKNLIDDMYYLEDDFSSPQNMFGAAIERYQINTGTIENALKRVKVKIKSTTMLYDSENYL